MEKKSDNKLTIQSNIQKFQKLSCSTIILTVGILTTIIGILAVFITIYFDVVINFASEKSQFKIDNVFLNILFSIIALGLLYLIYKILPKINKKVLLPIILAISLIIGITWVKYLEFRPISDQAMIVYCAEKFIENDLPPILNPGEYINRNPHQLGFAIYIMTVFRILLSKNVLSLQILNVIYSTISGLLLYLICKEIFEEDIIHKICLILILLFSIYWAFFSPHVYGNLPRINVWTSGFSIYFKILRKL